jgi:hypothetical protein
MPRAKRDTAKSNARRNNLGVGLTDDELAMVQRVADRYGLTKSSAARLLILAAAPQHDPSPPIEGA